jgi:aminomethyltransferase
MLVVNASNVEKDFRWLRAQNPEACEVLDKSEAYALLALQGPRAQEILQALTPVDLPSIAYYRCAEGEVDGHPATIARTGYTGEDGFEIFVPPAHAEPLWRRLIESGREKGIQPAGLGARDTYASKAKMCLYGHDMDETTSLVEAGLAWIVSLDEAKGDFPAAACWRRRRRTAPPASSWASR